MTVACEISQFLQQFYLTEQLKCFNLRSYLRIANNALL